eukprot:TRINITY_DN6080_c0_g1_i1.p1 TRINITY_DN6080_c0_g1~~TRINITY_DN6080_c0_g1_i1.p1  ORF type:complete len:1002 (+),score=222.28 TRINITY_DN6080_c0_g1_i1:57-3062(+)
MRVREWLVACVAVGCAAQTREVPAVIEVPDAGPGVDIGGAQAVYSPNWDGPGPLGVLGVGDGRRVRITETDVRENIDGISVTIGVKDNGFRQPLLEMGQWKMSSSTLSDNRVTVLELKSNLYPGVHDKSFASIMSEPYDDSLPVFQVTVTSQSCTDDAGAPLNCRMTVTFPQRETYDLQGADEHIFIIIRPDFLRQSATQGLPYIELIIEEDERVALQTAYAVTTALLVTMGLGTLVGGSTVVAVTTTRHLTLQSLQCGEMIHQDELLINPEGWYLGYENNPFLLGGVVINLCMVCAAVLLHAFFAVFVHPQLGHRAQVRANARERVQVTTANPVGAERREDTAAPVEPLLWGLPNSAYKRSYRATRFPNYIIPFVLCAFAGTATGALLIFTQDGTPLEIGVSVLGLIQLLATGGFVYVITARVRRSIDTSQRDRAVASEHERQTGNRCPLPAPTRYAEYIELEPLGRKPVRKDVLQRWFFGDGAWVSTCDEGYVERYGGLFAEFTRHRSQYLLLELLVQFALSLVVALRRKSWSACVWHELVVIVILSAYLASLVYFKPWRTPFDQKSLKALTALQILSGLLAFVTYEEQQLGPGPMTGSRAINYITTVLLLAKNIVSTLLPVFQMALLPHVTRLTGIYHQGIALARGRQRYEELDAGNDGGGDGAAQPTAEISKKDWGIMPADELYIDEKIGYRGVRVVGAVPPAHPHLRPNDVITHVENIPINSRAAFYAALRAVPPGAAGALTIRRRQDGLVTKQTVNVKHKGGQRKGAAAGGVEDLKKLAPLTCAVYTTGSGATRDRALGSVNPLSSAFARGATDGRVEDNFEHDEDCLVHLRVVSLRVKGAAADTCPLCDGPKKKEEEEEPALGIQVMSVSLPKRHVVLNQDSPATGGPGGDANNIASAPPDAAPTGRPQMSARSTENAPSQHVVPPRRNGQGGVTALGVDVESEYLKTGIPGGWVEYLSDEGHPYYHNRITGETKWELPAPKGPNPHMGDRYEL